MFKSKELNTLAWLIFTVYVYIHSTQGKKKCQVVQFSINCNEHEGPTMNDDRPGPVKYFSS